MKYSYTIVLIVLILNQILFSLADELTNQQSAYQLSHSDGQLKTTSRNKRQIYKSDGNLIIKRNDYNHNYDTADELDESELSSKTGGNQKKSKFVAWGGKKRASTITQKSNGQYINLNDYLTADNLNKLNAIKRFRSWKGKRASEKPFRTWGGKRSTLDSNSVENSSKLNDYLKRLETLNQLINELDSQDYD